jgi:trehalose synthase
LIERIDVQEPVGLDAYAEVVHLTEAVRRLREEAAGSVAALRGRKVWMVNSTAQGGGVAEMLPKLISMLNELGLDTEWAVMGTEQRGFFDLTKRLHNLIHGMGDPGLSDEDRELYAAVSSENAAELKRHLRPQDIVVVHDPQPLGMGALLKHELGIPFIFRCHIGLDEESPETRAAWGFLRPFAEPCDYAIFSAPEYIPPFLAGRAGLITPAIDPLSYKNRELSSHKLAGILKNSGLARSRHPVVPAAFGEQATRLRPGGSFAPMDEETDIGIPFRPIVTQVSRWDRLKGFEPLIDAFAHLKQNIRARTRSERHGRRLSYVRLVLAGPDPAAVADDPEAQEVLRDLVSSYQALPHWLQEDVAIVSLPMGSRKHNALMVNALQRCSSLIVQNSLREGFAEAMWKQGAVLGSHACGIRQQIRDGVDGRLIPVGASPPEVADLLDNMLDDLPGNARYGQAAQRRVRDEFLIFSQARRWLDTLAERVGPVGRGSTGAAR